MAPNKKKKPASNPARGFATTSIPAKPKANEEQVVSMDSEKNDEHETLLVVQDLKNPISTSIASEPGKDFNKLTPEEFETYLEESSLQLLLERHGEKTNKIAIHQATKLKTEKRVLRPQSERLGVNRWLPEEVVALVLRLHESQIKSKDFEAADLDSKQKIPVISEEDLMIKIWTLELVLSQLDFNTKDRRIAITSLLQRAKSAESLELSDGKDLIWGLEECIDSLTLMCHASNLPNYDSQMVDVKPRINKNLHHAHRFVGFETQESQRKIIPTSKNQNSVEYEYATGSLTTLGTSEKIKTENVQSDSEDDTDPGELVRKYLSLKSQIFQICPEGFSWSVSQNSSKSKIKSNRKMTEISPELARLYTKVEKIESDILFDQYEASAKLSQMRSQLVRESAERIKFQLNNLRTETPALTKSISRSSEKPEVNDDDENTSIFGDIFNGPLESLKGSGSSSANSLTNNNDGRTITLRDFGKWTGVNPRRIFENACKSRDSSCKVTYTNISEASFSCQHSLLVEWSYSQNLSCPIEYSSVSCETSEYHLKVQMTHVSTPDASQSEAYISTVALFFLSVSNPKEEKAYVRLPPIWRDLWLELSNKKKAQVEMADRNVLRELRDIISGFDGTAKDGTFPNNTETNLLMRKKQANGAHNIKLDVPILSTSGDDMKRVWLSKISTPAFHKMLNFRWNLPIWNFKSLLLKTIDEHQVVIVCGETGCGKSTQVPAFILEHELSNGRHCKVYCTEPRRISAISLARRVSEELGEQKTDVGTSRSLIGYAIRLESRTTAQTRLVYATTGIVMRMLERSNDLGDITHLVLDEVHERSIDSDFLLIVLRKLMDRRSSLKVILMSATVDAGRLSKYLAGAPIINVPGRTYPVKIKYLEDVLEATGFDDEEVTTGTQAEELSDEDSILKESSKTDSIAGLTDYSTNTRNALARIDEYRIGYGLILKLLEAIATEDVYASYSKAILIFLPGIAEIRRLNDMISGHPLFAQGWYIYPLHSTIATEEQERAFLIPPKGIRKIVLATNIAETGITIPDVTCVIDTGKHREMRYDERRQASKLIESFISKANAKQRRGRAGRVQNGLCFHLFTKARYDNQMSEEQIPEMLRLSLQDLVLRVKICKLGGIEETLSDALDPPLSKNIRRAVDSLVDVKALTTGEELTPLGRQLAKLPLDVFLGKLVLIGTICQCLDGVLSIAAILSSKSPFSAPMGARAQVDLARLAFKKGDSDLLTVYNAYDAWRKVCNSAGGSEHQFCRRNFLNPQTLSNIEDLKTQLLALLMDAGFLVFSEAENISLNRARFSSRRRYFVEIPDRYNINNDNELILNSVIAWSFYPKLLIQNSKGCKGWKNIANNQVVSLHPTSVNKGVGDPLKLLSFYHIMQSSTRFYNAHETSSVEALAVVLGCGDAEFKMYSGVIVIDGNRILFSTDSWKAMLAIKILRTQIRQIMAQSFRKPGKELSREQQAWIEIWRVVFSHEDRDMKALEEKVSIVIGE